MKIDNSINITDNSVNKITNSKNVNIGEDKKAEFKKLMSDFLQAVDKDDTIKLSEKQDIIECATDITEKVENDKKVPNFTAKSFIDLTSKFASIGNFAINITKLFTDI